MSTVGLGAALQFQSQRFQDFSPWRMLKLLATIATPLQGIEVGLWAAVTGLLIAIGGKQCWANRLSALAALTAGALVPIGLVLLGHALGRIWPGTAGPADPPVLTLILVLYSLGTPWLLGHLGSRFLHKPLAKSRALLE